MGSEVTQYNEFTLSVFVTGSFDFIFLQVVACPVSASKDSIFSCSINHMTHRCSRTDTK
jgi:hypothetical protein